METEFTNPAKCLVLMLIFDKFTAELTEAYIGASFKASSAITIRSILKILLFVFFLIHLIVFYQYSQGVQI